MEDLKNKKRLCRSNFGFSKNELAVLLSLLFSNLWQIDKVFRLAKETNGQSWYISKLLLNWGSLQLATVIIYRHVVETWEFSGENVNTKPLVNRSVQAVECVSNGLLWLTSCELPPFPSKMMSDGRHSECFPFRFLFIEIGFVAFTHCYS